MSREKENGYNSYNEIIKSDIELYMKWVQNFKTLSPEEERELFHKMEQGDMESREEIIKSHLKLVISIASMYKDRGVPFADLIEEGNLGLLKAIEMYKPQNKCKFSTYASWWIKQYIKKAISENSMAIKVPSYMIEEINKWKRIAEELTKKLRRPPTIEEIANELNISNRRLVTLLKTMKILGSFNLNEEIEEFVYFSDFSENQKNSDFDEEDIAILRECMERLSDREKFIIKHRFGIDEEEEMTLEELGNILGLTRERVRQIENKALHKLFKMLAKQINSNINRREEE